MRDPAFAATMQRGFLDQAEGRVAPSQTISARTFVALAHTVGAPSAGGGHETGAGVTAPGAPDPEHLPHLTVGNRASGSIDTPADDADLEVLSVLGEGGMGLVHLARQRSLRREVAIKSVRDASDRTATSALCAEGVTAGALEHPNILPVHALGRDDNSRPLLVMKRIEGVTWQALLDDANHPRWDVLLPSHGDRLRFSVELLLQVCNAIAFAHSRGVVHRDLKPENVMIGDFGEVYVLDWGLAVPIGTGRGAAAPLPLAGTPAYMAPEMVRGEWVGADTDVYLIGGMLHAALTGRPRHTGASLEAVLLAAYQSAPIDYTASVDLAELPRELTELANRATDLDRSARPANVRELRTALSDYLEHRASIALSRSTDGRYGEIMDEIGQLALATPQRRAELYRAVRECQFGYRQALEQWQGNPNAREGFHRCIENSVEIELAEGHVASARSVLDEHPTPPAELTERVHAAEQSRALHEAETARLRSLASGLDPTAGRKLRLAAVSTIFAIGLTVSIMAHEKLDTHPLTTADLLRFGWMLFGTVALVAAIAWRWLIGLNRKLAVWTLLMGVGIMVNRFHGSAAELPIHVIFSSDLLLEAVSMATASLGLLRILRYPALVLLAGSLGCLAFPDIATWIFTVSDLCALGLIVALWRSD